ncbi:MAG: hypothetical protein M3142_01170 [Bacteroidota bacterium]|nr:hypothetical protein [Bacteroidota bacterium]
MKKYVFALIVSSTACWFSCSKPMATSNLEKVSLVKKWETEPILNIPESVLYDKNENVLYVSSINGEPSAQDGNGFISKVSTNGQVTELNWITGLDAPKGMGLVGNLLYIADLTKVVVVDTKTGQKVKEINPTEAQFLNDITVDAQGNVYVSDTSGKKV